jgi:hypothetical protein
MGRSARPLVCGWAEDSALVARSQLKRCARLGGASTPVNWTCGRLTNKEYSMNQYGAMAQRHWARWLPGRFQSIRDRDNFFSTLGEEAGSRIDDLTLHLAGRGTPGEGYLARLGRLNMARLQAEEIVLREMVLLEPEPKVDAEETEGLASSG